jgi:hypothetical protein
LDPLLSLSDYPLSFSTYLTSPERILEVGVANPRRASRVDPSDPEMAAADPTALCDEEPGLAACYAAEQGVSVSGDRAGLVPLRLVVSVDPKPPTDDPADTVYEVRGVNIRPPVGRGL